MSDGNPETLAEQVRTQQMDDRPDFETAARAAWAIKPAIDREVEAKTELEGLSGIKSFFKKVRLKDRIASAQEHQTYVHNHTIGEIRGIERMQSNYLSRRFYSQIAQRAKGLGLIGVANELTHELEHTPHEVYDRREELRSGDTSGGFQPRPHELTLLGIARGAAGVIVSDSQKAWSSHVLSSGSGNMDHNPLKRASLGFGGQGEKHAGLSTASRLLELLGKPARLPQSPPNLGHFSLGISWLGERSADKQFTSKLPVVKDSEFNLRFGFNYRPESTRSSGEDVVYIPDELSVTVSKIPQGMGGGGGRRIPEDEIATNAALSTGQ